MSGANEALRPDEPRALTELKAMVAERCKKFGMQSFSDNLAELVTACFDAGRETGIEESLTAARAGFENSMERYVIVGPSGMAAAMLNYIRALKDCPNE